MTGIEDKQDFPKGIDRIATGTTRFSTTIPRTAYIEVAVEMKSIVIVLDREHDKESVWSQEPVRQQDDEIRSY